MNILISEDSDSKYENIKEFLETNFKGLTLSRTKNTGNTIL